MSYYSVVWISFAISEKPSRMREITFFYIVLEATRVYQVVFAPVQITAFEEVY